MSIKQYIEKLEPIISNNKMEDTNKYIVNNEMLPFLRKLRIGKAQAQTFEFINLSMLAWAFGSKREKKECIKMKTKSKFKQFLSKLLKNKKLEIEFKEHFCSLFKDLVVVYTFTILVKAIIDNNFLDIDFNELKEKAILNNIIGTDEEKIQIDNVFNKITKEDFNKAIFFVKENKLDELVDLIKKYFECSETKEVFTKEDVKKLLNAFDFTR